MRNALILSPFRLADELLRESGFIDPPVDVEGLARTKDVVVRYVAAPDDVSGLLLKKGERVVIGVNRKHHVHRRRFTIAHELGHWLLHCDPAERPLHVDQQLVYFRDDKSAEASDRKEISANAFAAALLMPRESLLADLDGRPIDVNDDTAIRRLARRYQVSTQALTLRLVNLGLVEGWPPVDA